MSDKSTTPKQLLHLVFGGELTSLDGVEFREWWFIRPPEYFSETAAATRAAFRR